MRRLVVTLTATAAILFVGALAAEAAVLHGNALSTVTQNFTPIKPAACRGSGPWCGPGYTRRCGPFRCWCRPCY
jgi:hypothetical protein